jgi:hypothetical protein
MKKQLVHYLSCFTGALPLIAVDKMVKDSRPTVERNPQFSASGSVCLSAD